MAIVEEFEEQQGKSQTSASDQTATDDPRLQALFDDVRQMMMAREGGASGGQAEMEDICERVLSAFLRFYDKPPVEFMEVVLRKRIAPDEARQVCV